jgi:DNA-binding GntR family transcriptional regulator
MRLQDMNDEALKKTMYENLLADIVNLVRKPNDFINEAEIARGYGVSRTPVREVLKRLAQEK